MIDTKLINIEGIWGSGKTTSLIVLSRHLIQHGIPAEMHWDEEVDNPVLAKHLVYAPSKTDLGVEAWERFSGDLERSRDVAVMEGALFNVPMTALLTKGYDEGQIIDYCRRTFEAAKEINPVLFYLRHSDVASGWNATCKKRGEGWRKFMEQHFHSSPPLLPPAYSDMVDFLCDLTSLMDRAFEAFPGRKLALATPPENWRNCHREMTDFLSLPPVDSPDSSCDDYIGRYREAQSGRECAITVSGNILVLRGYFGPKRPLLIDMYAMDEPLIEDDRGRFCIPDHICVDVAFGRNGQRAVASMRVVDEQVIQAKGTSGDCCKDTVWVKVCD